MLFLKALCICILYVFQHASGADVEISFTNHGVVYVHGKASITVFNTAVSSFKIYPTGIDMSETQTG